MLKDYPENIGIMIKTFFISYVLLFGEMIYKQLKIGIQKLELEKY
jgi:hypothetical protein